MGENMHDISGVFSYREVFDLVKTRCGDSASRYVEELLFGIEEVLDKDWFWGEHAARMIFCNAYPESHFDDFDDHG